MYALNSRGSNVRIRYTTRSVWSEWARKCKIHCSIRKRTLPILCTPPPLKVGTNTYKFTKKKKKSVKYVGHFESDISDILTYWLMSINFFFSRFSSTATRMFPGTTVGNGRTSKMGAVQQTLPRSKHKFPAPAPPQVPKGGGGGGGVIGGGRSPAGSSTTTTTATPSPVNRFSRVPHWPNEAIPKRVKKLSWDDRNSCAHMTVITTNNITCEHNFITLRTGIRKST